MLFPRRELILPCATAVAVSGGPDSVALLWLLSNYAREGVRGEGRPSEVVGLTVDHLLRPSSTQEALNVSMLAASLGEYQVLHCPTAALMQVDAQAYSTTRSRFPGRPLPSLPFLRRTRPNSPLGQLG